ncbi:NAD(P)-binding protein [Delitschia confertaspora ATCC 74209]|uniref:NAD(P)-binding protein n=1 Tax=Delitschia confertaspora ATCC 74209 TaxID=1513339 RepID=A0A9P4JT70_9PLEO|nr:NAD(P)-binding protein [Delitschia confertaspora ATCC 74209]
MPLTILTDAEVRTLLHGLTKSDILDLQQSLADALHYYSTATEEEANGCCSSFQPLRTALKRNDGQTTLFMPASSNDGLGVKIVTLSDPTANRPQSKATHDGDSVSLPSSVDSLFLSTPSPSSTTAFDVPESRSVTPNPSSHNPNLQTATTPRGSITLLDKSGAPRAFLNAEEITAFRTALASTMLFKKRSNVHDISVFGAGKQAYWHIRLALLLRGPEIHHLNIINRSFANAQKLLEDLYSPKNIGEGERLARPKFSIITPGHKEYERHLKATVRGSSVIFCTTPSTQPLFPASYLTNPEGRKKGRYIAAIGSYKSHMVEIHPDIIRQNVAPQHSHHYHKHARQGGAIIVDSVEACLKEAGEIIQAGIGGREVVEIGELVMLKRDAERRRKEATSSDISLDSTGVELAKAKKAKHSHKRKEEKDGEEKDEFGGDKNLVEWLQKGNVIYKSVGLGLMDVVVGNGLVRLADERGIGTRIADF